MRAEPRAPLSSARIVKSLPHYNLKLASPCFWWLPVYPPMRLQLLTCMDSLTIENTGGKPVVVIGATNRPNDLDSALRRAGRFDREICLGVPDLAARARILQVRTDMRTAKQQRRYVLTYSAAVTVASPKQTLHFVVCCCRQRACIRGTCTCIACEAGAHSSRHVIVHLCRLNTT